MFAMRACRIAAAIALCSVTLGPGSALALDLEQALRQATAANPELSARAAMAEAARHRAGAAGAWPSPMLEAGYINVPTTGKIDADPMSMKMVGLSQRVPVFGANRLARSAARAQAGGAAAAAEWATFEVWGMTWEAYADAYYAGVLVRLAGSHGTALDHMVMSARSRYASGSGRLEDLLRAQAEQARALADVASFQAEERAARARLDALCGGGAGGPADSLAAPPPVAAVPPAPAAWLAAVTPAHPQLMERQAEVERYRLSARAARRMLWPDLELRGSYGWREDLVVGHGGQPQDDMFSATVGFMLPIFGRARGEAAEMDAMARASEAERAAADLALRARVSAAHARAAAAQRTVGLLADTVLTTQRRAVEASWVSYRAGATDLWRVFEAVHSLYTQEIALTRARQELADTQAQMLALTGRGDLLGLVLPARPEPTRRSER